MAKKLFLLALICILTLTLGIKKREKESKEEELGWQFIKNHEENKLIEQRKVDVIFDKLDRLMDFTDISPTNLGSERSDQAHRIVSGFGSVKGWNA
jgi:hypothetical protein